MHELYYPPVEKEATGIIECVQKWKHLLWCKYFTLITDQRLPSLWTIKREQNIKTIKFLPDSRRMQ